MLSFPLAHSLNGAVSVNSEERVMSTLGQVIVFPNKVQQMG